MSNDHFDEGNMRKFILAAFLGFVVVFCFLMIMMQWHGDYKPGEEDLHAVVSVTEGNEPAAEMPEAANKSMRVNKAGLFKVTLSDGVQLNALKAGIEDKLVAFLNNNNLKAGQDAWFDFDNLNFKSGSAELTPDSYGQVQNIAAILKAYPKLKIKIGGYTDKTGDSITNLKLSQDRANAVLIALKNMNANPEQLVGAEGYGSQYAKAAVNAPDEGRKKDRRISLSVREK